MKNSKLSIIVLVILGAIVLSAAELVPSARASSPLEMQLFAPVTASPGQTISIGLFTLYDNLTNAATTPTGTTRPDLAYNATSSTGNNQTLTFNVKINLGIVAPPHIHTPSNGFVALPPFKVWTHKGAWMTNYTVPSQLGLYAVHVYGNYTVVTTGPLRINSYIGEAQTTFMVQSAPAPAADLSTTMTILYGVLGLAVVAIVLDALILFWKKSPAKPQ